MVAITVVLAAAIGAFGLGDDLQQALQSRVSVTSEATNGSHDGDDPLSQSEVTINVDGNDDTSTFYGDRRNDEFSGGDTIENASFEAGSATVTIIHRSPDPVVVEREVDVQE